MSLGVSGLRALAHPFRLRVLSLLTAEPRSAAEVARELDVAHASASYHLRQLLGAGLVEVAEERSNRGGRERRYRTVQRDVEGLRTPEGHVLWTAALAEELGRRSALVDTALPATTADAELWVDPALWQESVDRVRAAVADLHAAAQPARAPGAVRVGATVALFGMRA